GLRWPMILGTFGTAAGACIKIASAGRDLFWIYCIGQTVVAVAQVFMLSIPPVIAAVWFGEKEVATACAIGVIGNQFGIICSFLITPLMVHDHPNVEEIGNDLLNVFYIVGGYNVAVFILTLLFFQNRPPLPPSPQQAMQKKYAAENKAGYMNLMKRLLLNKSYVLLVVAYCISVGVLSAGSTLLNQILVQYEYEHAEELGGNLGTVSTAAGIVGSLIFGLILDRTHSYRSLTVSLYVLMLVTMVAITYSLPTKSQIALYLTYGFNG
ncbi:hypothetical protein L9F63_004273, partial [Diploptera punctata]